MTCREFEDRWNELLDSRSPDRPAMEPDLESHATNCDRCRNLAAGYQVLRQAIASWPSPPNPSPQSLERLHELKVPSARPRRRVGLEFWVPMATAAALFGLVWLGGLGPAPTPPPVAPSKFPAVAIRPLGAALTEATEATIDLAREVSAPATRIGREVLEYEEESSSALPSNPDDAREVASEMLHAVGEQVNAGVRPISGSARHAFSFLLGPPPDPHANHPAAQGGL